MNAKKIDLTPISILVEKVTVKKTQNTLIPLPGTGPTEPSS